MSILGDQEEQRETLTSAASMRNRAKSGKTTSVNSSSEVRGGVRPTGALSDEDAVEDNVHDQSLERVSTKEETIQTEDGMEDTTILLKGKRPWTQYRRIIFVLGCLLGILVAWVFQSPDLQLESLLDAVDMADFFDDLKSALPSALPIGLVREAREIQDHSRQTAGTGAFSIGEQMAREGMTSHYPVVMVDFSKQLSHEPNLIRCQVSFQPV